MFQNSFRLSWEGRLVSINIVWGKLYPGDSAIQTLDVARPLGTPEIVYVPGSYRRNRVVHSGRI